MNSFDMWSSLQFIAALLLIISLTYALARVLKSKLKIVKDSTRIHVAERCMLDHKNALYVVEIDTRQLLISSNEQGVRLLTELDMLTCHPRAGGDPGAAAAQSNSKNLLDSRLRGNDKGEPLINVDNPIYEPSL